MWVNGGEGVKNEANVRAEVRRFVLAMLEAILNHLLHFGALCELA